MEPEEYAADQLAGGIAQQGYQCGLLWGAIMGVGAEVYNRSETKEEAVNLAVKASARVCDSFEKRAGSLECEEIINYDLTGKNSAAKLLISGKFISCLRLADKWAPEAIQAAKEGLSLVTEENPEKAKSCASVLVKNMGGSDLHQAIVAGFAGGTGLKGNGCGALAACIWMNMLKWYNKGNKVLFPNPRVTQIMDTFLQNTDYEFYCHKICGRRFNSVQEHTDFVNGGGCSKLIEALCNV